MEVRVSLPVFEQTWGQIGDNTSVSIYLL